MKDLKAIRGYRYIAELVERGEDVTQDFKLTVNDARKIARTVSAFANNAGGHLLIGVKDNGVIAGIRSEEDIFVVEQAAQRYCTPPQQVEFTAFRAGTDDSERPGTKASVVIRAYIAPTKNRPVSVIESDGSRRAYFRVADENIVADPLMTRAWQRAEDNDTVCSAYDDIHRQIIDAVNSGIDTPATIARAIHASQRLTDDAIVTLLRMDILHFDYIDNKWHLC